MKLHTTSSTHSMITRHRLRDDPTFGREMALISSTVVVLEPKTFCTVVKGPCWVTTMEEEYQALLDNQTWRLVPRPSSVNVVGSKWVYKLKYKEDGTLDRFKAWLVAQGYTQVSGEDYNETI